MLNRILIILVCISIVLGILYYNNILPKGSLFRESASINPVVMDAASPSPSVEPTSVEKNQDQLKNVPQKISDVIEKLSLLYGTPSLTPELKTTITSNHIGSLDERIKLLDETDIILKESGFTKIKLSDELWGFNGSGSSTSCSRRTTCTYIYTRGEDKCEVTANFDFREIMWVECM